MTNKPKKKRKKTLTKRQKEYLKHRYNGLTNEGAATVMQVSAERGIQYQKRLQEYLTTQGILSEKSIKLGSRTAKRILQGKEIGGMKPKASDAIKVFEIQMKHAFPEQKPPDIKINHVNIDLTQYQDAIEPHDVTLDMGSQTESIESKEPK
jgi:hypothetical protein